MKYLLLVVSIALAITGAAFTVARDTVPNSVHIVTPRAGL